MPDNWVVEDRQPDHITHGDNMSESLARKAVGEMNKAMIDTTLIASSVARGRVMTHRDDGGLLALPSRTAVSRALQRGQHRMANIAVN